MRLSADNSLKQKSTVHAQREGKVKDELEYATNWRRAFHQLFTKLKWLSAYSKINYIALQKAKTKFMKSYFHIDDNVLDKKLQVYIDSQAFSSSKNVKTVI